MQSLDHVVEASVAARIDGAPTGRATISDVAARAGVSIATVSRVTNGADTVHPKTAHRVRVAMKHLSYEPHSAGRSLASRKSGSIGALLLTPAGASTEDVFFLELLRGLESAVERAGLSLIVSVRSRDDGADAGALRLLTGGRTDGLVIAGGPLPAAVRAELARTTQPVVLFGPQEGLSQAATQDARKAQSARNPRAAGPGSALWSVVADSRRGTEDAVTHLIEIGRRRIAHIGGPLENTTAAWKREGFLTAHARAGAFHDSLLHVVAPALHSRDGGFRAAETLMDSGVAFDAIYANDDLLALGAIGALHRRGMQVPQDVAVAGYGDIAEARFATPALTSVHVDFAQQGWLAGTVLVQAIDGTAPPAVQVKLDTTLVVRASSAG